MECVCGFMAVDAVDGVDGLAVALVRKAKPAWQAGRLNGVGGKVEPGERPVAAMVREFVEETGVQTRAAEWGHRVTLGFDGGRIHFFAARRPAAFPLTGLPGEPVAWVPVDLLGAAPVLPNLRWLVPLCLDDDIVGPVAMRDRTTPQTGALAREKATARAGVTERADGAGLAAPVTALDVVREYFPGLPDARLNDILWTHTGFPAFWPEGDGDTPEACLRTQLARLAADPAGPAWAVPELLPDPSPTPAKEGDPNTPALPGVM